MQDLERGGFGRCIISCIEPELSPIQPLIPLFGLAAGKASEVSF